MRWGTVLTVCLVVGCGARSTLDPDGGQPAPGGSPSAGGADNVGAAGGQASAGGSGGTDPEGGQGPQGGEGPLCPPALCASWEVTLDPGDLVGFVEHVASDPCGNISLTSRKQDDGVYVTQLDPLGAVKWSRRLSSSQIGDPNNPTALVAGTPSGDVVVAFSFETALSIDGFTASNVDQIDIALVRLDDQGNVEWLRSFGADEIERPTALAVSDDGDILLGGYAQSGVDLGGGPLEDALFLARFSASGEHRWSYRFAETGKGAAAFATQPDGAFWVLGRARRDVQFPGGPLFDGDNFQDRIFVAHLTQDGTALFSSLYGDSDDFFLSSRGFEIAARADGGARFVAAMVGTVDFGGGILTIGQSPIIDGVADVSLTAAGDFISASQLTVPVGYFSSAIGPEQVFLGEPGSVVQYGAGVVPLLSFESNSFPVLTRVAGGIVSARVLGDGTSTVVTQLCDGDLP